MSSEGLKVLEAAASPAPAVREVGVSCLGRNDTLPNGKSIWFMLFMDLPGGGGVPGGGGDPGGGEEYACDVTGMAMLALYKSKHFSVDDGMLAFAMGPTAVQPVYLAFKRSPKKGALEGASDVQFSVDEIEEFFSACMHADRSDDKNHLAVMVSLQGTKATCATAHLVAGPLTVPPIDKRTPLPMFKPVVYGAIDRI